MENIFVEFLPPWIETGLQPAFYDKESGTVLQQTARMYARVNMLIRMFNKLSKNCQKLAQDFLDLHDYVQDYFDNLDVQEEINNKINAMVADGTFQTILDAYVNPQLQAIRGEIATSVGAEADARTSADNGLQLQINGLASGSPLVASSTAGMTDTSKVYVNTTDGKWYYYDGNSWEVGGTYQSTAIANDSVSYANLTEIAKARDYKVLRATDLIWQDGVNYYLGNFQPNATDITSCNRFRVSKGDVIEISTDFNCRLTFWNPDGSYVSNTGSFTTHASTLVAQDGWCAISLQSNPTSGTFIDHSNITNAKIVLTALRDNRFEFISKPLEFTTISSTVAHSNKIYVGAGTVVKLYGGGVYNSDSSLIQDNPVSLYVNCYDRTGNVNIAHSSDYSMSANYTVAQDCYIDIQTKQKYARAFTDEILADLGNMFEIDYVLPTNPPLVNKNFTGCYIGSNGTVEYMEGVYGSEGHIAVTWDNDILVYKGSSEPIVSMTVAQAQEAFPDHALTYGGKEWIDIPHNNILCVNLENNAVEIVNWKSANTSSNIYPLLINGYQNMCGGALYELYLKKKVPTSEIFNSAPYEASLDWKTPAKAFSKLLNTSGTNIESFTFFTDQHLMLDENGDYEASMPARVSDLQKVYNSVPMNFIVSGGDWLNNGDTADQACFKLGYVDGFMTSMFKNSHLMVGNHDTNYQGVDQLSNDTVANLWFRDTKKAYYSFDGKNSKNYVFDSGLDHDSSTMDSYRWEQIDWFAKLIKADNPEHATVFSHIVWSNSSYNVGALADNFTKVIKAFNDHSTITLNGETYDFTGNTGHIDYVLSGHLHEDHDDTINGVLCIATNWFGGNSRAFDLVLNDYNSGTVKMVRVGSGSDRTFSI